jgi:hypothetical protein
MIFGAIVFCVSRESGSSRAGGGDFDNVSIAQMKVVTKFYVGCDLNDGPGMMTSALLVGVSAKNKCAPAEDGTRDDVDRNRAAIFLSFKASDFAGQAVRMIELNVQGSGKEVHSGLSLVMIVQLLDPIGEVSDAGDDFPAEYRQFHLQDCFYKDRVPSLDTEQNAA